MTAVILAIGVFYFRRILSFSPRAGFMARTGQIYVVRPWRQLDADAFRDGLISSTLCQPDTWKNYDVDSLARLYDKEISAVLD